jgi:hypothetical protein
MQVTVEGLEQGYVVVPCAKRFVVLYSFLKRYQSKKVMVFFSSCNSVKFHADLLKFIGLDCLNIHGKQKQNSRTSTFFNFCKAEKGILLCTDVAARGLDIPAVVCYIFLLSYMYIFLNCNIIKLSDSCFHAKLQLKFASIQPSFLKSVVWGYERNIMKILKEEGTLQSAVLYSIVAWVTVGYEIRW